jgi:predicted transcriptional regulator
MSTSETLTVRLPTEVKKKLGRLANHTNRTKSFLASEAIADFVARELAIVEGIKRGLDDMHAGRVVPHAQAMRRLKATVAGSAKKKT